MSTHDETTFKKVLYSELIRRSINLYIAIVVTIVGAFGMYNFVQNNRTVNAIRDTQTQGSPLLQSVSVIGKRLNDCFTPGTTCFAARTATSEDSASRITSAAVACAINAKSASVNKNYEAVYNCVINKIQGDSK